jgi:hypothetical protein
VILNKYYLVDQIKEYDMNLACSRHGKGELRCGYILISKPNREMPYGNIDLDCRITLKWIIEYWMWKSKYKLSG